MRNTKFTAILMALVAMSFFRPSFSLAQTKPFNPQIKTQKTELSSDKSKSIEVEDAEDLEAPTAAQDRPSISASSPRRLQQHGLGLGLGQTFVLGKYGKYGEDKITMDLLYSYAASYSFDLLVNAHMSEHKDKSERMKLMGLTSSIKGRFVEYDNFSPYFLGGLGFYAPRSKRLVGTEYEWSDQKITFGLNFGGGIDLRLNDEFVVGVMGQMHAPFAVKQDEGPDVRGYYFKLLITGMYLF